MSVWREIRQKSLGKEERIENTWPKFEFPRAIKVTAKTFNPSNNIILVQPMAPPTGKLFFFK